MKKLISKHALVAIAAGGMLFSSCGDHDMFNPNYKKNEYAANWETKFGKIDPAQDWSMATTVKATANVAGVAGKSILKIYNYSPLAPESRVLGVANLNNGIGEVTFDALKGVSTLFVTVEQDNSFKVFAYYSVENGQLLIGENASRVKTRAFSESCPTTKGDNSKVLSYNYITGSVSGYVYGGNMYSTKKELIDYITSLGWLSQYNLGPFNKDVLIMEKYEWGGDKFVGFDFENCTFNDQVTWETWNTTGSKDLNVTYLKNVEKDAAQPWKQGWGEQLFGPEGNRFFEEFNAYYEAPKCGTTYPESMLGAIEEGFTITSKGGEIELPFIFGATQNYNQFGYVFYKDNENPIEQPHYVLIDDATPQNNIYWQQWGGVAVQDMELGTNWDGRFYKYRNTKDLVEDCTCRKPHSWGDADPGEGVWVDGIHKSDCGQVKYQNQYVEAYNKLICGTKFKLVYFDENGNATYNIPKGLHIAFFVYTKNTGAFTYSTPELNEKIGMLYDFTTSPSYRNGTNPKGKVRSAAWTFKGHKFLGFEDGADQDLNDIVFWVEGAYETDEDNPIIIPDPDPDPDPDPTPVPPLPDTESQSWILACEDLGSTDDYDFNDIVLEIMKNTANNSVEVRCLAAGGTIPAYITYNDVEIGEAHALLGGQTNQMINTYSFGAASEWQTLTGVSADMSIDEIIKNISIRVTQNEGDVYATEIKAPETGEAPQMIIVPGDWEWPSERKGIETAYPDFTNWSSNASLTDWNSAKVVDKVVRRK